MKPARVPQTVVAPDCWGDLPWGELYRKALERQLNPWFTKMYGFHLLKIGNLSAEINCEACAVSHQVNVSAQGMPVQVQADPLHLPLPINPLMFVYWHIPCRGAPIRIVYCVKPIGY